MKNSAQGNGKTGALVAEWRQHWRIGLAAMIGMGLGLNIVQFTFSIFILPLQDAFGWTRGQIGLANYAFVLVAIAAPFAGRWIDRVGARIPLLTSTILAGLAYFFLGAMTGSLMLYYFLFGLLVVGGMLTSGFVYARVICMAFVQTRGLSLAIGRSGVSIGAAALPIALFAAISQYGWRGGYFLMAALILGISLPVAVFWIKGKPAAAPDRIGTAQQSESIWSLLTDRLVVTIALAGALAYLPLMAILSQAQPLLVDKGLDAGFASTMVGLTGAASVVGALFTGYLLDRLWAPGVAAVMLVTGSIGALILAYGPAGSLTGIIGIMAVGVTLGAEVDIVAYVIARFCGMRRYSTIFGFGSMVLGFAVAAGPSSIGLLYDHFGDYRVALTIAAGCFLASAGAYLSLGRYPAEDPE